MARRFVPTADGVEARLDRGVAELLRELCADLAAQLELIETTTVAGPIVERLFPDGYRDDPEAAAELRSLIQDDLRDAKVAAARSVVADLDGVGATGRVRLGAEQAEHWLTALNDLRLALGTGLGVTEDAEEVADRLSADDLDRLDYEVYLLLGWLQESLVDALSDSLG